MILKYNSDIRSLEITDDHGIHHRITWDAYSSRDLMTYEVLSQDATGEPSWNKEWRIHLKIHENIESQIFHLLHLAIKELNNKKIEAEELSGKRFVHLNQLQADTEAEQKGILNLRKRFGAHKDETSSEFIERLVTSDNIEES